MVDARALLPWTACAAAAGAGAACSLIATFDDRAAAGADAGAEADAGNDAPDGPPLVGAFALEECDAGAGASPLAPQPCNYRDESCSGFADLSERYEEKPGAPDVVAALACDPGALVAWGHGSGASAEVRILARVRGTASSPCPQPDADAGAAEPGALVLLRLDAATLAFEAQVPIEITTAAVGADAGADAGAPTPIVLGRSERRIVGALKPTPGGTSLLVLSTAIDGELAGADTPPGAWDLAIAADLPASGSFEPAGITAADAIEPGRFHVAIDARREDVEPLITLADEGAPAESPFGPVLKFKDDTTVTASRAALFDRSQVKIGDAGATTERVVPGAIALRADTPKTIHSNDIDPQWLTGLRYLLVPGAGTSGFARPWYAAGPILPAHPGAGFGTQSSTARLEIFSMGGSSYAQIRACELGVETACAVTAKPDGGTTQLDASAYPACDGVPLHGAIEDAGLPDAKAPLPSLWATCRLAPTAVASGVVTWHRVAGGFGAAIAADGATLWVVRPEGAATSMGEVTLRLATGVSIPPGEELAADGPLAVTFVEDHGWVVVAVQRATGRLWARRFGCEGRP